MIFPTASLQDVRARFAAEIAAIAGCGGTRIEQAFAHVPREDFLPPPPWRLLSSWTTTAPHSSDPADLYADILVAIDMAKGINNGQPSLHAQWIAAIDPQPGEIVAHVGCGGGYYSAILAELVGPAGHVHAYEIEPGVAALARRSLARYANVTVHGASAQAAPLPAADIVYVNAAASAPQATWIAAMRPGARMIFPWRFGAVSTATMLITRSRAIFGARAVGFVAFIEIEDEREHGAGHCSPPQVETIRSMVPRAIALPDASAVAEFADHWFSTAPPASWGAAAP